MRYFIHTYGCQMNYSDTERIESYLNQLGLNKVAKEPEADLIIFNSCSIRQKAEDRVLGSMENLIKAKRRRPDLLIALTGCMVRKSSTKNTERRAQDKYLKSNKPLDIAFRIEDLPKLRGLIVEAANASRCHAGLLNNEFNKISTLSPGKGLISRVKHGAIHDNAMHDIAPPALPKIQDEQLEDYFHISPNYTSKTQAFIPISTGCDKFCTYCIVPYARGRETSRNIEDILKEATELVSNGCKEITLLGQTVDSYGLSTIDRKRKLFDYNKIDSQSEPPPFVQLLTQIDELHKKGLKRLRFTSPHPKDVSPELIQAYAELKTLMPHIHLPIQSGDNTCLQRMNRPYTRERYLEIVQALRKARPDIAITTDIIVGFCGETEEEFQSTVDLYNQIEFDFCYIGQYSTRKGTFADKNLDDNVLQEEKSKRWHTLNNLMKEITQKKLKTYVGRTLEVIVEQTQQVQKGKADSVPSEALAEPTNKKGDPVSTASDSELVNTNKKAKTQTTYRGKSEHFKTVQFQVAKTDPSKNLKNTLQRIKITKAENWVLHGELA